LQSVVEYDKCKIVTKSRKVYSLKLFRCLLAGSSTWVNLTLTVSSKVMERRSIFVSSNVITAWKLPPQNVLSYRLSLLWARLQGMDDGFL
jgi:hypothetical protein